VTAAVLTGAAWTVSGGIAGGWPQSSILGKEDNAEQQSALPIGTKGLRTLIVEARTFLACAAAARSRAGLDGVTRDPTEIGIVCATANAGLSAFREQLEISSGETRHVPATRGPQSGFNAPAAQAAIYLNAQGPNVTLVGGATAAAEAFWIGIAELELGAAVMIIGAVDCAPAQSEPRAAALVLERIEPRLRSTRPTRRISIHRRTEQLQHADLQHVWADVDACSFVRKVIDTLPGSEHRTVAITCIGGASEVPPVVVEPS
jgi:Beta-ketoacyl synthase, N-terminal domain